MNPNCIVGKKRVFDTFVEIAKDAGVPEEEIPNDVRIIFDEQKAVIKVLLDEVKKLDALLKRDQKAVGA